MADGKSDPRHKNEVFKQSGFVEIADSYTDQIKDAISVIGEEALDLLMEKLAEAGVSDRQIFVAGNGGSASLANHMTCDLVKGTFVEGVFRLRVMSLTANQALTTAIANDFGYEQIFSKQIEFFGKEKDILILVSSSGQSSNIILAAEQARAMGMYVIGLTGFTGGELFRQTDLPLHVPVMNYGIVEDTHMMLIHIACQKLNALFDPKI